MKVSPILAILLALISLSLPACNRHGDEAHEELHKIVLTSPLVKDVVITQEYVCQIHSQKHINIRALVGGYLEPITIKEGQTVKEGEVLFQVNPTLYQAKYDAEVAEVRHADLEYNFTKTLADNPAKAVSQNEVLLFAAKLAKAKAKLALSERELKFATIRAPFDGIIDRLLQQQGSLIKEGDDLTTLSDNSLMWVYFNVPEARYLEYKADQKKNPHGESVVLVLADGNKFPYSGRLDPAHHVGAVEGQFNNKTGTIFFRADFPNPDRLLRHGQTGKVLLDRTLKNALVIPQRATYETLDKRYVFVVDKENVVHQRPIDILYEQEDIFIIEPFIIEPVDKKDDKKGVKMTGLKPGEKFVLEGVRQVKDGKKLEEEAEFEKPEDALKHLKFRAE